MKIFHKILHGAGVAARGVAKVGVVVVKTATPIVLSVVSPESLINVALGGLVKHGIRNPKLTAQIPAMSAVASITIHYIHDSVIAHNWLTPIGPAIHEGARQFGMAWAIHKSVREPAERLITDPVLARRIGPGDKASL